MSGLSDLENKIRELKLLKDKLKASGQPEELTAQVMVGNAEESGTEAREDLSSKVKKLVKDLATEGDYRFGVFVGNAGGKRKIIKCPHCNQDMVVAGIKTERAKPPREMTQNQLDWHDFVRYVSKLPEYGGKTQKDRLKIASKLRKEGITLADLKNMG